MPWNMSPIAAICLFGGTCFADRRWAFGVPLAAMFASDLAIDLVQGHGWGLHPLMAVVYPSYALMVGLGMWLRSRLPTLPGFFTRVVNIAGTAVLAETLFVLITNFADWVFQPELVAGATYYPHTAAGLLACYVAAVPFFKMSLGGMAVYATALFGGHELLAQRAAAPKPVALAEAR
jgi:hypothetical protein